MVNEVGGALTGGAEETAIPEEASADLRNAGFAAAASSADISTVAGADQFDWTALDRFGRLDIPVNNACIIRDRTRPNMTEAEWDPVIGETVVFLASNSADHVSGRVLGAIGGKSGARACEFEVTMSDGFTMPAGAVSAEAIAANFDGPPSPLADLQFSDFLTPPVATLE